MNLSIDGNCAKRKWKFEILNDVDLSGGMLQKLITTFVNCTNDYKNQCVSMSVRDQTQATLNDLRRIIMWIREEINGKYQEAMKENIGDVLGKT